MKFSNLILTNSTRFFQTEPKKKEKIESGELPVETHEQAKTEDAREKALNSPKKTEGGRCWLGGLWRRAIDLDRVQRPCCRRRSLGTSFQSQIEKLMSTRKVKQQEGSATGPFEPWKGKGNSRKKLDRTTEKLDAAQKDGYAVI